MKLSLTWKWLIVSLLVESMMLSVLVFRNIQQLSESLHVQTHMRLQEQATLLQSALVAPWLQMDYATIQSILEETAKMESIEYLVAIGSQSHIIASVGWKESAPLPLLEHDAFEAKSLQDHRFDTQVDVLFSGQKLGSVRIGVSTLFYIQAREAMLMKSIFIALIEVILSAVLLFSFGRWTAKHIAQLTQGANAIARGEYTKRLDLGPDLDTQGLASAFNTMAQTVQERVIALEVANEAEKKLLQEVSHQSALISSLLDSIPDLIFFKDTKGVYLGCNPPFAQLVGRSKEEIVGKTDYDMFDAKTAEFFRENDAKMMASCQARQNDEEVTYPDGRKVLLNTFKAPYFNNQGALEGIIGISRDITERKKAEEELIVARHAAEDANRVKSEFLANMSHELRTPLNAIMGMGTLLSDTPLSKEQSNFLLKLNHASELLNHLVSDILDYSKIEAGEIQLEVVEVNIDAFLEHMEALFRESATQKGIVLAFSSDADVPSLIATDALRLTQIINNLLSNALKFTAKGQVGLLIRLKNRRDTKHATLLFEVSDTGIGMRQEHIEALFQPFTQADNSTTREYGGTGLGLSIVRRLAHVMGGEIGVQSVEGRGSIFTLSLPVVVVQWERAPLQKVPVPITLEAKEPPTKSTIPTILIVDDTPSNIHTLSTMLKSDYRIKVAKDGLSALKIAAVQGAVDLILLDIVMPEMDGYAVCEQLKKDPYMQHIPVIFVTAKDGPEEQVHGFRLGAADYITKPFDPTVVKVCVKHQIELKCNQEELERLSLYDGLTQIANRRYFDASYDKIFKEALREKVSLAVLMMDIDYFKRYNDHYGHAAGDTCLVEVASALKQAVYRPSDLLARYGGEEFVVVLKDVTIDGACKVAHRLLQCVEELHLPHEHSSCASCVTLSIGVALKNTHSKLSQKELLIKADEALYEAKAEGRNRVVWHVYEEGEAEHGDL